MVATMMKPFSTARGSQRAVQRTAVSCGAQSDRSFGSAVIASVAAASLIASPALAEFRLPPIDKDPNRCERAFVGNTIGQANAVSDKVLDLRSCKYPGANVKAVVLSGALMSDADFSNANMQEVVLSKAYAVGANLEGADLTNAVVDRTDFTNANLKGVKFTNAVVTGVSWKGADLTNTDFEDALIGNEDAKRLYAS